MYYITVERTKRKRICKTCELTSRGLPTETVGNSYDVPKDAIILPDTPILVIKDSYNNKTIRSYCQSCTQKMLTGLQLKLERMR